MVRRLLLAGVLIFVGLPTLLLVLEHTRGRGQLAAALADLQARGEKIDLARLVPPTVPARSNGLGDFVAASGRLGAAGQILPPGIVLVDPARAFPPALLQGWPAGKQGSNTWAELERWSTEHAAEYDSLHESLAQPYRRSHYDWELGSRMLLPHLAQFKTSANALALVTLVEARRGDATAAAAALEAIHTVEDDLSDDPTLIGHLVRTACAAIANSRFWQVVHLREWTEPELATLQAALAPSDLAVGMARSMEFERALALYELRRLSTTELIQIQDASGGGFGPPNPGTPVQVPGSVDDAVEMAGTAVASLATGLRARVIFPLWKFAWGDQAIVYYLRIMDDFIRLQREAARQHSSLPLKSMNLGQRLNPDTLGGRLRQLYAAMLVPALERTMSRALRGETERELHRTGVALRRFQLRNQRLPDSLAELVPDFLPELPLDRMDAKPLRYRRDSATAFTLWSVGDDGDDDGGDATGTENQTPNRQWWLGRDAVWPQPADETRAMEWLIVEAAKEARKRGPKPAMPGTNAPVMQMSPEVMKRYGLLPKPPNATPPAAPAPTPAGPPSP